MRDHAETQGFDVCPRAFLQETSFGIFVARKETSSAAHIQISLKKLLASFAKEDVFLYSQAAYRVV